MDPDKASALKNDPTINEACSTDEWISPLNIGIVGTVWNALTYKTVVRIYNHPARFIIGLAFMGISATAAYGAMTLMPAALLAYKTAIIAGAFFAVI